MGCHKLNEDPIKYYISFRHCKEFAQAKQDEVWNKLIEIGYHPTIATHQCNKTDKTSA